MRRYDEHVEVRSGRIGEGITGLDAEQLAVWPEGPNQFVWRNRLWRVLGVQARWVESGPWWDSAAARAARGDDAPGVGAGVVGFRAAGAGRSATLPGRATDAFPAAGLGDVVLDGVVPNGVVPNGVVPTGVAPDGLPFGEGMHPIDGMGSLAGMGGIGGDDLLCEQEIWRVEAANGRDGGRGVYELAHAWADGSWRLRSVLD